MTDNMPTLILIPGLLSDFYVWQPVADAFCTQMEVVIADVSAGGSLTEMAADILQRNAGPLWIFGHSMGGRIALEMVRLAPDRVMRLVLADTGVHPPKDGEEAMRQRVIDCAHNEGMAALADMWLPPMVHPQRLEDKALMQGLRAMVLRADAHQHERQIKALLARPDASAGLAEITCPTLLLAGRQDSWSPVEQHEKMMAILPNAQMGVIEDAGHFAPIERPAEVIAALRDWIG
jgi:pimeloyl-ACP methyl ester carboxylesterase